MKHIRSAIYWFFTHCGWEVALCLVCFASGLTYELGQNYLASTRLERHGHKVIEQISVLTELAHTAAWSQREFLVTGENVGLTRFKMIEEGFERETTSLLNLIQDDPEFIEKAETAKSLFRSHMQHLKQGLLSKDFLTRRRDLASAAPKDAFKSMNELTATLSDLTHRQQNEIKSSQSRSAFWIRLLSYTWALSVLGYLGLFLSTRYKLLVKSALEF